LEDEIERLQLYLEIEHMRFGDKLKYELILDDTMEDLTLEIPSMILQPFVENAIWHGILPQDRQGYIEILFHMYSYDVLEVLITDNGPGIAYSKNAEKPHHTSMSMDITRERLILLGKQTGKEYAINISEVDSQEGGTQVYLQIPVR
jgi:LytS/YehU family sensor histidine kinase